MSKPQFPEAPGAWESRAFFAALLAACRGEDKKAADILRDIAASMEADFLEKGVKGGRTRRRSG